MSEGDAEQVVELVEQVAQPVVELVVEQVEPVPQLVFVPVEQVVVAAIQQPIATEIEKPALYLGKCHGIDILTSCVGDIDEKIHVWDCDSYGIASKVESIMQDQILDHDNPNNRAMFITAVDTLVTIGNSRLREKNKLCAKIRKQEDKLVKLRERYNKFVNIC